MRSRRSALRLIGGLATMYDAGLKRLGRFRSGVAKVTYAAMRDVGLERPSWMMLERHRDERDD